MAKKDDKELLKLAHKRFKRATEADQRNRQQAMDDLKFVHVPGQQWDQQTKFDRGNDRPMYEFNKLRVTIKRIVNDMRANRPMGKVRGTEDNDTDTAENLEGLIRNICAVSDFDTVIDHAGEYQVASGMGAWRVSVDYADDEAFEQDISIKAIKNPFCLYSDPASQDPLKRDAGYWFLTEKISRDAFKAKWPKADPVEFDVDEFDDKDQWEDDDEGGTVRICEYWWKEPLNKTLLLLSNGMTVDAAEIKKGELDALQLQVVKTRPVKSHKIRTAIISGDAILEGPSDWAGSQFPFVQVFGESIVIDGETKWHGLVRFAKDAARAYNYSRTCAIEAVALAPTAKWWATPDQAAGNTERWSEAHKKNFPFLLFNPDPKHPGAPQRMGGADIPAALVQEMQISSDDIKAVTGIYDASLGNRTNETSGIAIRQRQAQGEIACYNYSDNMGKGIRRTWEILIDLIPKIYDTQRSVRILGSDGAEKFVEVNKIDPMTGQCLNDLSRGKYDVTVTIGPNFSTARQEASEVYMQMAQANPNIMAVAGDLIFKALDLPYAEDISERMKALLPPPIQQQLQQGDKGPPPEVQQAMQQVQSAMQQVEQHGMLVQKAAEEVHQEKALAEKAKSEITLQLANLKVAEANLAASEAQFKQLVAETQLAMNDPQDAGQSALERQALEAKISLALSDIQAQAAQHRQDALNMIAQLHQATQPQVIVGGPSPSKTVRVRRVNGELVGEINDGAPPMPQAMPPQPGQPMQGM